MNNKINELIKSGKVRTLDQIFKEFSPKQQKRINERVRFLQASLAIKNIRKDLNLTQQELADKMKVKREIIARAESGKHNITLETLYHIAEATNHRIEISFS